MFDPFQDGMNRGPRIVEILPRRMGLTWCIIVHNAVSYSVDVLMIVKQNLGGSHRVKLPYG